MLLPSLHWFGGCPPKSAAGQTFFWYFAPLRELKKPYWKTSNLITTLSTSISHHQLLFWLLNHPFVGPSGVKTSVDSGHLISNYTVCVSASNFLFLEICSHSARSLGPRSLKFRFLTTFLFGKIFPRVWVCGAPSIISFLGILSHH